MSSLVLCSTCRRHVRLGATTCPFCSASITSGEPGGGDRSLATRGLSRARMYARYAAIATGVAACGGSSSETSSTDAAGDAATDTAASDTGAATDSRGDASGDGSVADAGADTPDTVSDAPPDTPCCPPYGCVFPDTACGGDLV